MAGRMRVFHPPREPGTVLGSVDCKPKRVLSRPIWGVLGALVGTHSLIDIVLLLDHSRQENQGSRVESPIAFHCAWKSWAQLGVHALALLWALHLAPSGALLLRRRAPRVLRIVK